MTREVLIKRFNAYYKGWCLAFGEHEINLDQDREVYWLFGEDRIGLAVKPHLRRILYLSFLGRHETVPQLILEQDTVRTPQQVIYQLADDIDREGLKKFKAFINDGQPLFLFLTSHFCYPSGTQIITIAREKPPFILYKEMQPLNVVIHE